MSRAAAGAALGALAAALAVLGHVAGGGESGAVMTGILVAASALVFAAAAELRAPLWTLAGLGALVQMAGHLLLAPLGGHAGAGGHAHGMPGQAARGPLDSVVAHLSEGGATMIAMHAISFAVLLVALAVAEPLAGLLLRLVTVLAPSTCEVPGLAPSRARVVILDVVAPLRHVVVRRGPPAFV